MPARSRSARMAKLGRFGGREGGLDMESSTGGGLACLGGGIPCLEGDSVPEIYIRSLADGY